MWIYICIYHILCHIIISHHTRHHIIARTTSKHEIVWSWYQHSVGANIRYIHLFNEFTGYRITYLAQAQSRWLWHRASESAPSIGPVLKITTRAPFSFETDSEPIIKPQIIVCPRIHTPWQAPALQYLHWCAAAGRTWKLSAEASWAPGPV